MDASEREIWTEKANELKEQQFADPSEEMDEVISNSFKKPRKADEDSKRKSR